MNKKILTSVAVFAILILSLIGLTGCTSKKSFTYKVETGDKIKVEMNTTGGYDLTSELPIKFSKDDEVISEGSFGKKNAYDTYSKLIKSQSSVEVLEEDETKNLEYIFYKTKNTYLNTEEYNYIIKIKNSDTCFMIANKVSEDSARDIFKRLKFTVEK